MKISALFTIIVLSGTSSYAKRVAGPEVKAITKTGITYSYSVESLSEACPQSASDCGTRLFLVAHAWSKTEPIWKTEIFQNRYNMNLETDVQTILPRSLKFAGKNQIELVDERQKHYLVDAKTGKLVKPAEIVIYDNSK